MKVKISTSSIQTQLEEVDLSLTTRRGSECLIGRSPDSDLVLDSDDVSRLHGKFFSQGGNYYFCDVGSRNGSIVNGKLAEKNHSYVLKNGDIIRIGDFTLMLEEEIESQQAETVVRIINPSVFSNWRPQNESAAPQQELQPAIDRSSNELVSSQIDAGNLEETEKQEIVNTSKEVEAKQQTQKVEQSEPTFIQPEDVITPDIAVESPHESNEASEYTHETTIVQLSNVNQENVVVGIEHDTEHDVEVPQLEHEHTIVQTHDVVSTENDTENFVGTEHDTEHDVEAPQLEHEHTIVQTHDVVSTENDTEHVVDTEHDTEHDVEAPQLDHEHATVQAHDVVATQDVAENIASTEDKEEISAHNDVTQEVDQDEEASSPVKAISNDSENIEVDTPSQQVEEELVSASTEVEAPELQSEDIATSQDEELPETEELEESFVPIAKILEEKQIVLVGHDSKKAELTELVAEHEEFLSYCLTRTWQTFSDDLYKQTGLSVTQEIPPASSGGYQAINSLVNSGEILAVIFLRDLMVPQPGQASEEALLRICNINNVLLATNLPTAQAVLHYLKNLKD